MDSEILKIKTVVPEPRVLPANTSKRPHVVKPIPKDEGAFLGEFSKDLAKRQGRRSASRNPGKAKDLRDEIQLYLSDMKISASFELYDKAGDLVVKITNPDTNGVIREITSEDLHNPREKCEKVRGVLFARRA
jgi:uncharacterized FlaG/YvyC family protein